MSSNEDYIKKHNLKKLMDSLMEKLLQRKPESPAKYLIKLLQNQQLIRERPKKTTIIKPKASLGSPRARTYDKPWQSNSVKVSRSVQKRTRPAISSKSIKNTPGITVVNDEEEIKFSKHTEFKYKTLDGEKNERTGSSRLVTNKNMKDGTQTRPRFTSPSETRVAQQNPETRITSPKKAKVSSVRRNIQVAETKVSLEKPQYEFLSSNSPFNLSIEGTKLSIDESTFGRQLCSGSVKFNMDTMITQLQKYPTRQKIDDYLSDYYPGRKKSENKDLEIGRKQLGAY